jgi:hypothetical protein
MIPRALYEYYRQLLQCALPLQHLRCERPRISILCNSRVTKSLFRSVKPLLTTAPRKTRRLTLILRWYNRFVTWTPRLKSSARDNIHLLNWGTKPSARYVLTVIYIKRNGSTLMFISIFSLILFNNFLGLFPYIFTRRSHLVINLTLAPPLWVRFIIFGWINNTNHIFEHLVHKGPHHY